MIPAFLLASLSACSPSIAARQAARAPQQAAPAAPAAVATPPQEAGPPAAEAAGSLQAKPVRSVAGAQCNQLSGYDAIVVGAGLAGLSAARELIHLGHTVLVLESNDRIGGRAYTGEIGVGQVGDPRAPIDYGGAWIHGVPTNPLTNLVDLLGFKRFRSQLNVPYYIEGKKATEKEMEVFREAVEEYEEGVSIAASAAESELAVTEHACKAAEKIEHGEMTAEALCGQLTKIVPNEAKAKYLCEQARRIPRGISAHAYCGEAAKTMRATPDAAADYVPGESRFRDVLPLLVANAGPLESAAELRDSSATDLARFAGGEDDLVDKSLGAFVRKFGEDVPVCLNSAATKVGYSEQGVTVETGVRRYAAKSAVVTVSVGVLRAKKIAFEPALPEWKMDAIEHLPMGNMQKVIIPFRKDVFGDAQANSWVLYEGPLSAEEQALADRDKIPAEDRKQRTMALVIKPLNLNIAIGFFGGNWAKAFEGECRGKESGSGYRSQSGCDDLPIKVTAAALTNIYGDQVGEAMQRQEIHITRWSLDATSLGAYSAPLPGYWNMREVLGRPVGAGSDGAGTPRLFFAGEGTGRSIYSGSYPGAYESGLEAARLIHETIEAHGR